MPWKKKRKNYHSKGKNRFYSVAKKLKKDGRINEEFEIMINGLLLEEVIALKLETATKAAGGALYGLPIWYSLRDITRHALIKFALSATRTKVEAARFLGMEPGDFYNYQKEFGTETFFSEDEEEKKFE